VAIISKAKSVCCVERADSQIKILPQKSREKQRINIQKRGKSCIKAGSRPAKIKHRLRTGLSACFATPPNFYFAELGASAKLFTVPLTS